MQSPFLLYHNHQNCIPPQHTAPESYYPHVEYASQDAPYFPPANYPLFDQTIFTNNHLSPPLVLPPYGQQAPDIYHDAPVYHTPQYAPLQPDPPSYEQTHSAHIHSPIPISAYSTLLAHVNYASATQPPSSPVPPSQSSGRQLAQTSQESPPYVIKISPAPEPQPQPFSLPAIDEDEKPRDMLEQYDVPQVMFPTPSELLADIAKKEVEEGFPPHLDLRMPIASPSTVPTSPVDGTPTPQPSPEPRHKSKWRSKSKIPAALQPAEPGRPENLRKSYFRTVADQVGFQPTDPDTITSHDKKRYYLESLEQYILWLHEQIRRAGHTPIAMHRIDTHRGLNSRSIRTLLVHKQDQTRKLHSEVSQGETQYFSMERRGVSQPPNDFINVGGGEPHLPFYTTARRHSIANGNIPMCPASHVPPHDASSQIYDT